MDSDEEYARRLQAEYDEEARVTEEQEHQDAVFAQEVATGSHDLSESDDEVMEARRGRKGKKVKTDKKKKREVVEEDSRNDEPEERRAVASKVDKTSTQRTVSRQSEAEHDLSDEDEELEEPETEVPQDQDCPKVFPVKHSLHKEGSSQSVADHDLSDEDEELEELNNPQVQETRKVPVVQEGAKGSEAEHSLHKEGSTESKEKTTKKRPLCKFGSACYRKNPWHLEEFYHPHLEGGEGKVARNSNSDSTSDTGSEPQKKRQKGCASNEAFKKITSSKLPFPARLSGSQPFNLFLNKSYSIKETHDDPLALVFPDLLNPELGEIVESAQLNFMVDLEFLMTNYKAGKADCKPLLVMYGEMEGEPKDYACVTCTKVNLPFLYGTHHTKMMLFQYKAGLRVVVHTANLVPDDWYEKTQGFWVSPIFPELENGKAGLLDGESPTRFKRDLVEYLLSYKAPDLTRWSNIIKKYDFSSCNVMFVGSTPGYHTGEHKDRWGHMKVRRAIRQHTSPWKSSLPIIAQCSSIGSLGKDARSWLSGELGMSFTGAAGVASPPMVDVVYPSEDDIGNSSQGWMGGSCLPYNSATHEKQTWLLHHFNLWRSEKRKRTRVMPHIKTYTRINKSSSTTQFLLLTSANLSKAAWGMLQKQNSQLFIRSYEAGVLMLPKFITDSTEFKLTSPGTKNGLSLPYDVPLTPYPDGATPWFMNTPKKQPDIFDRTYP